MSAWHLGPLAGFDVESTGPDPLTARIVTATVAGRGYPDAAPFTATWLADPGVEIPEEAAKVHGVTTERARAEGRDAALVVAEICDVLTAAMGQGAALVIYNAVYDLTVLDRETRRHGMEPFADVLGRRQCLIVDPFVLDKALDKYRKGKRTLTAACEHYQVKLEGAHDATADALAAMRVAWRIGCRYPDIAAMTPDELHEFQVDARAEQARSFQDYLRRQGKPDVIDSSWPIREYTEAAA